jgi:hypothetical protein
MGEWSVVRVTCKSLKITHLRTWPRVEGVQRATTRMSTVNCINYETIPVSEYLAMQASIEQCVFLEKLAVAQLVKIFPFFCGT